MKTLTLLLVLSSYSMGRPSEDLIKAIAIVESSNNPKAIGDGGAAAGLLQIHMAVIKDVNRVYGTSYKAKDRLDPTKSKDICRKYLTFYGELYTKRTGKSPTLEIYARCWNGGGPRGYEYKSTISYWNRVKKHLKG
jgi:hypothetical protein